MIIEALKEIQAQQGLTDAVMAEKLGMHHMSWSRLKNGRSGITAELVRQSIHAWPETAEAGLIDLFGENYKEVVLPLIKGIIAGLAEKEPVS